MSDFQGRPYFCSRLPIYLTALDDYLSPILGHHAACQARHGKVRSFTVKEITARQDRGSDHNDVLGKLLAIHQEKPDQFDQAAVTSVSPAWYLVEIGD